MTTIARAQAPAAFTATREQRRAELHAHPAAPPGLEVHAAGLRHEVQRGDSAWGIARDYSQAYHMDISPMALIAANRAAFADGLHPGELLVVPGLQQRFDTMIEAGGGAAVAPATYVVARGDTLSSLARRATAEFGRPVTWQQLHAANRDVIGSNPNRILPGQELVVPGTGSDGYPVPPLQTLSELDQDVVLTRVGRIRDEAGNVSSTDVMYYKADASHATAHASADEAITTARRALRADTARSNPLAVVQTRDGQFQLVPLRGEESGTGDDSTNTLSLAYRANDRGVTAVVEERWDTGAIDVRRFDR